MVDIRALEAAIWSIADGRSSPGDLDLVDADARLSQAVIERFILDTEEALARVSTRDADERELAVADFSDTLASLHNVAARFRPPPPPVEVLPPEPVQLQASWSGGQVVVWAAGRGTAPEANEELATRLEAIGGPPLGWEVHPHVTLPDGEQADALAIPLRAGLGWLVALAGGEGADEAADSLRWLARTAVEGVRIVARGAIVPSLHVSSRRRGRHVDADVRWKPALLDQRAIDTLAKAMPAAVAAIDQDSPRATTMGVVAAVIQAIVTESAERGQAAAQPPSANTVTDLWDTIAARLDGVVFTAEERVALDASKRLGQWSRPVIDPAHPRLSVRLEAPTNAQSVWQVSINAILGRNEVVPLEAALRAGHRTSAPALEWARLARIAPSLNRLGPQDRGRFALSQDEAWEFMTVTGPSLAARRLRRATSPALSRGGATPSLRLFAEAVGRLDGRRPPAQQRALVGGVRRRGAHRRRHRPPRRPGAAARAHRRSVGGGRHVDLAEAAAALAERADAKQLTGAEILRQTLGLDGAAARRRRRRARQQLGQRHPVRTAREVSTAPAAAPDGFVGELRSYQAEALAWIGFLDAAGLGGCLALDMGLGKTPTVLAHLARAAGAGPRSSSRPPAVVGNWAAEAARFTPELRVVVHHGADRCQRRRAGGRDRRRRRGDHHLRHGGARHRRARRGRRGARSSSTRRRRSRTRPARPRSSSAASRRAPASRSPARRSRTASATCGPSSTSPTPASSAAAPAFIAADVRRPAETALRALNGILLFRRTKAEPEVAAELPDKIDELDHCSMTPEQIGLYQAVLDQLVAPPPTRPTVPSPARAQILAAITALKQICNHPAAYQDDDRPARRPFRQAGPARGDRRVGVRRRRAGADLHPLRRVGRAASPRTSPRRTGTPIACYHGGLARGAARPHGRRVPERATGAGALVLSLKAGGTGLNLTAANHVVLYDRWWNPAVEDQARDRAWRIGQTKTVISHRLVCPGTVDERVEEVVAGKRHIAELVLPKSSSLADLDRRPAAACVRPASRGAARGRRVVSPAKRRHSQQHRRPPRPAEDFWHGAEALPELDLIVRTPDPTALMRSLGELPINDDTSVRLQVATVVERAAAIAAVLADTAGLVVDPDR